MKNIVATAAVVAFLLSVTPGRCGAQAIKSLNDLDCAAKMDGQACPPEPAPVAGTSGQARAKQELAGAPKKREIGKRIVESASLPFRTAGNFSDKASGFLQKKLPDLKPFGPGGFDDPVGFFMNIGATWVVYGPIVLPVVIAAGAIGFVGGIGLGVANLFKKKRS